MKWSEGPNCQSCGMPLARDPAGGGTHRDGGTSAEYCSHCFRDGAFTQPNLTAAEMVANVESRLRSLNLPEALVQKLSGHIPTLGRWRQKP